MSGDIGLLLALNLAAAVTVLGGGLLFGTALFRAKVLARWAAALLAAGSVATLFLPLLPQVNDRLFALPSGVALIGLGYSLWSGLRRTAARTLRGTAGSPVHPEAANDLQEGQSGGCVAIRQGCLGCSRKSGTSGSCSSP